MCHRGNGGSSHICGGRKQVMLSGSSVVMLRSVLVLRLGGSSVMGGSGCCSRWVILQQVVDRRNKKLWSF